MAKTTDKKEELEDVTEVIEVKKFTNLDAIFKHYHLKTIDEAYFGVAKNSEGEKIDFNFDISKLRFTDKLLYALAKNIKILKSAVEGKEEIETNFQKVFKKEFDIKEEDLSDKDKVEAINKDFSEFTKRDSNKEILKEFNEKEFTKELHKVEEKELEDSSMPSFLRDSLDFLKKE